MQMQPQVSSVSVPQPALAVETGNQNMLLNTDIRGIKLVYEESSKLTKIYVDTQYGLGYISGSVVETETMVNRINEIVKYLYGLEQYPYSITDESH